MIRLEGQQFISKEGQNRIPLFLRLGYGLFLLTMSTICAVYGTYMAKPILTCIYSEEDSRIKRIPGLLQYINEYCMGEKNFTSKTGQIVEK